MANTYLNDTKIKEFEPSKCLAFLQEYAHVFQIVLVDHPLGNDQPYESETGHCILNGILTYS